LIGAKDAPGFYSGFPTKINKAHQMLYRGRNVQGVFDVLFCWDKTNVTN